jgi:hypothetical protein
MTDALFPLTPTYPESVLLSIYQAYPRKCNRKEALKRIREALDRICAGEIDGDKRSVQEAITFLRGKTDEARQMMAGREESWIPHATTYYHQSRYLRAQIDRIPEMPARLANCINILAKYPKMPRRVDIERNVNAFMPALAAIDKALERMEQHQHPINCARRLESRTELYAMAVKQWPVEDLQFVPNPKRFYDEDRFNHDEATWNRQPANGFGQEREQLKRLLQ